MVMMHQCGIRNVVASCGTSLTSEQVRLIRKFTNNVTIMYDGDSAGIHAAMRGIGLVLREGLDVHIVLLPDGEDPDSFSRKHTRDEVREYIETRSRDFISFKSDLLMKDAGNDPLKKAHLINDIADTIADVQDPVKRSVYVEDVARRFNLDSALLFQRIASARKKAKEEALKEREREERRARAGLPAAGGPGERQAEGPPSPPGGTPSGPPPPPPPAPNPPGPPPPRPPPPAPLPPAENPILEPAEKELLTTLLKYGADQLEFETDSEFYSGDEDDKPYVADFIRSALDADQASLANTALRKTYDAYMALFEEGYSTGEILRRLCDSSDRTVARVTAELCFDRHQLTVKHFEESLTTRDSWLVTYVPKILLVYTEKRIVSRLEELKTLMAQPSRDSDLSAILKEYSTLSEVLIKVRRKSGRVKSKE